MRKLILGEWMSLDGFLTDKDNQLTFFENLSPDQNTYSDQEQLKFLENIDTVLFGRKTYELFADFWPEASSHKEVIADKLNQLKKIVFSNTLLHAPWGHWPAAQVISGEAVDAIRHLKLLEGRDMVMWGSISLAQVLIKENLIDEYRIQLCPVFTGGGRTLFLNAQKELRLTLKDVRRYDTGAVFLNYTASL